MGGTAPICPFCHKLLSCIKDHVRAKHPNRYPDWIAAGQPPYWQYDSEGNLQTNHSIVRSTIAEETT
jgi:hypothetical protein